ncbi:hypothetical protein SCHPADRAFT_655443 [Schizopora paradoxa]|uniref:Uncharacterized protein n=1 Tax=Schizopora paradoxa TaxID=27342 RepID=A0A0H2R618_9AGAM|nr:hypothetical protein SCHPADRAFT_655443 [Schizopora paradoxa]
MPFNRHHQTTAPRAHSNVEVIGLFRAPTISSIDTDATIDDQPGAGRTVGRFLSSLGSKLEDVLNKQAERVGLGPKAVADEICRLAGHRQIWITVTDCLGSPLEQCLPVPPGRKFNKTETKSLRKLCQKLIEYARSHVKSNQFIALEEIVQLAMKDPRIRVILAHCNLNRLITHYNEPNLLSATVKALGAVEFSDVHRIWTPIFLLCSEKPEAHSVVAHSRLVFVSMLDAIETIRDPPTSFLSARYFHRAVQESRSRDVPLKLSFFLSSFTRHYTRSASQSPSIIEWSTFEKCTIQEESTGNRPFIFDDEIFEMATVLDPDVFIRHLSFFLVQMFPISQGARNSSICRPSRYRFRGEGAPRLYRFLSDFTGSCDYCVHLSCTDHLSNNARIFLKGTIFVDKIIFTACVLTCHTTKREYNLLRHNEVNVWTELCSPLVSYMKSDCPKERSLATTLTDQFCTISRYCKLAAFRAAQEILVEMKPSLALANRIERSPGDYRVPRDLLRMFRPNSYGIWSFGVETFLTRTSFRNLSGLKITKRITYIDISQREFQNLIYMDIMELKGDVTVFMSVNGDEEPFCANGHHPILAFQSKEEPSKSFYIARVKLRDRTYYTHVEDGASFVTYQQEKYNVKFSRAVKFTEKRTSKFEVLVLRYDPVDYRSPLTEGELMDPTGPLGWINIYTRTEVSLADYLDWFP